MPDKKITISLAGKEVVCNFGVNWYYKYYYDQTGNDLLTTGLEGLASSKMFGMLPAIFYAAYKAECSMNKQKPELTFEDFETHLLSSDEETAAKMLNDFISANGGSKKDEPGEAPAQT